MEGTGPSPLSSTGAAQATPEITETATSTPKYATPTAIEGGNFSLNLTLTTSWKVQELPADTDSDVTLAGRFGVNNDDLDYIESNENLPTVENTTPDLLALIK